MAEFILFIGIFALFALLIFGGGSQSRTYLVKKKCVKQPHLDCPLTVELTAGGGLRADGHFKCCKIISQMKAMNKAFARMEPGVSYNGISINKSVRDSAKARQREYEALDDSGPLGYNTKEHTDDN